MTYIPQFEESVFGCCGSWKGGTQPTSNLIDLIGLMIDCSQSIKTMTLETKSAFGLDGQYGSMTNTFPERMKIATSTQ